MIYMRDKIARMKWLLLAAPLCLLTGCQRPPATVVVTPTPLASVPILTPKPTATPQIIYSNKPSLLSPPPFAPDRVQPTLAQKTPRRKASPTPQALRAPQTAPFAQRRPMGQVAQVQNDNFPHPERVDVGDFSTFGNSLVRQVNLMADIIRTSQSEAEVSQVGLIAMNTKYEIDRTVRALRMGRDPNMLSLKLPFAGIAYASISRAASTKLEILQGERDITVGNMSVDANLLQATQMAERYRTNNFNMNSPVR